MRQIAIFPLDNLVFWKKQLLHWAAGYELAVCLDSNGYETNFPKVGAEGWECLVAAGAVSVLEANAGQAFERLSSLHSLPRFIGDGKKDWLFGFFGYDLKNEVERLSSQHFDGIGLSDLGFFQPEVVVGIRENQVEIHTIGRKPERVFEEIKSFPRGSSSSLPPPKGDSRPRGR